MADDLTIRTYFLATPDAWAEFMNVIENPPEPSPALVRLFRDGMSGPLAAACPPRLLTTTYTASGTLRRGLGDLDQP